MKKKTHKFKTYQKCNLLLHKGSVDCMWNIVCLFLKRSRINWRRHVLKQLLVNQIGILDLICTGLCDPLTRTPTSFGLIRVTQAVQIKSNILTSLVNNYNLICNASKLELTERFIILVFQEGEIKISHKIQRLSITIIIK